MSMYYLNNVQALKVGNTENYIVIYKAGYTNALGGSDLNILTSHEGKVLFTRQGAMTEAIKQFSNAENILKRKSRSAQIYNKDGVVKAFQRALNKKEKFNVVESLNPEELQEKYFTYSKIKEIEPVEGIENLWYRVFYHKLTADNCLEWFKKIEENKGKYSYSFEKRKR